MIRNLREKGVAIKAKPPAEAPWFMSVLVSWLPMIVLIGVWIFFMRQMQGGGGGKAMSFGKSRARLLTENHNQVTFEDVAGVDQEGRHRQGQPEVLLENVHAARAPSDRPWSAAGRHQR